MTKTLILKHGREKALQGKHPWIYSNAVVRVNGNPQPGETVLVRTEEGKALGWAAYSPLSQIRARMWNWDVDEVVDEAFLRRRLQLAIELRVRLGLNGAGQGARLVHAESDGLPGLIVDRYADVLVMQILSVGVEVWREQLTDWLMELTGAHSLYERSDVEVRRLEGLQERKGLLRGENVRRVVLEEHGLRYGVDVEGGQKTGFYLDQRENRRRVGQLAAGRRVLNCFCYTGGFSLAALAGGAEQVLSVDSSAEALRLAQENLALNNGLDASRATWLEGDVFTVLRQLRDEGQQFDLVILDPPKFAPTAVQAARAARGYKDINWLGFRLLRPGGLLATFSCSGGISPEFFQKIVADAAADANVAARVVAYLHADADHPVALSFPEGEYLKGLICAI